MSTVVDNDPWEQLHELYKICDDTTKLNNTDTDTERTISYSDTATVEQVKWVASILGGPSCTTNAIFVTCLISAINKQLQYHRQRYDLLISLSEKEMTTTVRKRKRN